MSTESERKVLTDPEYKDHSERLLMAADFATAVDCAGVIQRIDMIPPEPLRTVLSPLPFLELREGTERVKILREIATHAAKISHLKRELDARAAAGIPGR